VRRSVIMGLMCQRQMVFEAVREAWLVDCLQYFAPELEQLPEYQALGLVEIDVDGVQVTATGWYLVRAIALVFDRYFQDHGKRAKFSRII
jgi:oxygen-independent coproporphyrinogen-3 oxidase